MQLFCLSVIVALSELPVNMKFRVHTCFVTFCYFWYTIQTFDINFSSSAR